MRRVAKVDTHQKEIMEALRACGAKVWFIGYPLDLLVAFRERFYILEVKTPGKKPTKSQIETMMKMGDAGCKAHVVYSVEEAMEAIGIMKLDNPWEGE